MYEKVLTEASHTYSNTKRMKRKKEITEFHNWMLEASAGAYTPWHVDAAGSATWVEILSGMKLWLFSNEAGRNGERTADASDYMEVDGGEPSRKTSSKPAVYLDAVFLHEGMIL
jgi:hypothetical protein